MPAITEPEQVTTNAAEDVIFLFTEAPFGNNETPTTHLVFAAYDPSASAGVQICPEIIPKRTIWP